MDERRSAARDDRVLAYTRWLSLFITPVLLVAFVLLYVLPEHTARLWAWSIPVTMTSMVLASAYFGGVYFFVNVASSRSWHEVATGFLAVTLFAGLLGIATVIHWGTFLHSHVSFWLWAGLYFTTPFLVIGAWLANHRYAAPRLAVDVRVGPVERVVIGAVGLAALGFGLVMFVSPSSVIDRWPWPLTSLSCRVVAATFCLGGAGVATWFDARWTSLRLMLRVQAVMLLLMLLAAVRARDEMISDRPLTWPLLAGVLVALAGSVGLLAAHERQAGGGRTTPKPATARRSST